VALVVQAMLAILLLAGGGSFRQFFSLAIFAEWLFYMIASSTIFVFRKRESEVTRPYRVWGYPLVPALFIAASAVLLYFTFVENVTYSLWGSALILAGIPVFYGFSRRTSRSGAA
jgi:basic amino acid/polyamine antiporter, APA family